MSEPLNGPEPAILVADLELPKNFNFLHGTLPNKMERTATFFSPIALKVETCNLCFTLRTASSTYLDSPVDFTANLGADTFVLLRFCLFFQHGNKLLVKLL